jgi:enterochelin esterase-like enzyme
MFVIPVLSEATMNFEEFLDVLNSSPIPEKYKLIDDFITSVHSFPIIEEDTLVHFITRQKARSVFLAGDFNNWKPDIECKNVSYTDLWYYTTQFEPDARLDYKFVINGDTWILDQLNPQTIPGGFGDNSELIMPNYMIVPEIKYCDDITHGTLKDTALYCEYLKQDREVVLYLPHNYSEYEKLPFILFQDGGDYLDFAMTKNILDYLIFHEMIKPIFGVFISPVKRTDEYAGDLKNEYGNFIAQSVFPFLYNNYPISHDPEDHAVIGASNGGNISLWLGFHYPELFRKIGAQSSYVEESLQRDFQNTEKLPLTISVDMGKYDIPRLEELVAQFIPILSEKGYSYTFKEFPEGHSWGNWRGHLSGILIDFFSK